MRLTSGPALARIVFGASSRVRNVIMRLQRAGRGDSCKALRLGRATRGTDAAPLIEEALRETAAFVCLASHCERRELENYRFNRNFIIPLQNTKSASRLESRFGSWIAAAL